MSENLLKSLTDVTKVLAETAEASSTEVNANMVMLVALYTVLLNKGVISLSDVEAISGLGQGNEQLSERIKARIDIIKRTRISDLSASTSKGGFIPAFSFCFIFSSFI